MQADPVTPNAFGDVPNVTGQSVGIRGAATSYKGALTLFQTDTYNYLGAQQGGVLTLDFNASKSSSVYKATSKISVKSFQTLIIIKSWQAAGCTFVALP